MAATNPVVKQLLDQYSKLPNSIKAGINPVNARTSTFRGGLGASGVTMIRNMLIEGLVNKIAPGNEELVGQAVDLETALQLGQVHPLLGAAYAAMIPTPVGATEELEMQKWQKAHSMQQKTTSDVANADKSAQAALSTNTPPPATGNRVETSTVRDRSFNTQPQQAPVISPITQAALTAADTGYNASTSVPLSQFYAAQKFLGSELEKTGELQRRLKESGGAAGMSDAALMAWAQKNPGLAYRELVSRESRANAAPATY
jgi:hypothetical protein